MITEAFLRRVQKNSEHWEGRAVKAEKRVEQLRKQLKAARQYINRLLAPPPGED